MGVWDGVEAGFEIILTDLMRLIVIYCKNQKSFCRVIDNSIVS
jgi:hypothetical protein